MILLLERILIILTRFSRVSFSLVTSKNVKISPKKNSWLSFTREKYPH